MSTVEFVGLPDSACWDLLRGADHAVLATLHPSRGADVVPVVFAVLDAEIVVPIDTLKPKSTTSLQRLTNIARDPRATVLADHYDATDWSRLWWVRVNGTAAETAPTEAHLSALADKYAQYTDPTAIWSVIVVVATEITGWRGEPSPVTKDG